MSLSTKTCLHLNHLPMSWLISNNQRKILHHFTMESSADQFNLLFTCSAQWLLCQLARLNHRINFKTFGIKNIYCQRSYLTRKARTVIHSIYRLQIDSDFVPSHEPLQAHECFITIKQLDKLQGKSYSDLTGCFPIPSSCGNE